MIKLPPCRKIVLDSKATLLYQKNPFSPTVAFGVWMKNGSRDEADDEYGLAHFLEHMIFRGTKNMDSLQIAYTLESIGGQWDAFTSKEATCYHGKVLEEHFGDIVDVFSEMIVSPSIPGDSFDLEKLVITEEIASVKESCEEMVNELFFEALFAGHPLAHPVTGHLKDIRRYDRNDLLRFHEKKYVGENALIGFVGNIPMSRVVEAVSKGFKFKRTRARPADRAAEIRSRRVRSIRVPESKQSHVCIGSVTVPATSNERYALALLSNILGGGVTSRLFQGLREKLGLAYSVFTTTSFWKDTGFICSYFSVDPKNLPQALEIFHRETADIIAGNLEERELESAVAQVKGSVIFEIENVENRLFRVFQNEFYHKRYIMPNESIRAIERVTLNDIVEAASKYLAPERLTYTTCGPVVLKGLI
ncbi:MAG: hypothetical protein B6D63_06975 [Candidatus Latescibacteria bacterium 4484_7]|nr:MAG: hypothetical protein B6D63_06975 [Candidatus Latescibacteria bacterium 4484_7]